MSDDLVKRLTIKAGVMDMGEKIAWGSDTALMREAADEITRLQAQVAAAYLDAADTIQKDGVLKLVVSGHDDAAFFVAKYGREIARARIPADASAALDALLEKAVKAALEEAGRHVATATGSVDLYQSVRAIDPQAIVAKVKGGGE